MHGRQGDPGSSRYFLSLEDNMFRVFGGERIRSMMSMFRVEDLPMESKMLASPDTWTISPMLGSLGL